MIMPFGISPVELTQRTPPRWNLPRLEPDELRTWLLGAGLAEERGELLCPTPCGAKIGAGLELG